MKSKQWYLTVVAIAYLVVCGCCTARYLFQGTIPGGAAVPWHIQVVCPASVLASVLYLFRPDAGRRALMAVFTAILIACAVERHPAGFTFHCLMLFLTLLPVLGTLNRKAVA